MASSRIVFLMYHELELPGRPLCQSEPGYVRYILSSKAFQAQIDWLRQAGWRGLCVGEALNYPAGNSVAITFDDGSETDLITAAPLLKERGFNATFYVTAGFLGKRGYLSPTQLRELSSMEFEIGCHSMTHAYLDDLEQSGLQLEIADAGKRLEDLIGKRVEHFSCPGGRYSAKALALAKEAGYRSLATSHAHANSPSTDPFELGRVAVMRDCTVGPFQQVCSGDALWKMRLKESTRGAAKKLLGNERYDRLRARWLGEGSSQD
jgi:peptidoglycan/xylan/chitin deacetylase (PgdA/CDA1 family)